LIARAAGRVRSNTLGDPFTPANLGHSIPPDPLEIVTPIGANRGYVGLADDPALLAAVDKALSDLQAAGTITELGQAAGLTYLPPHEPAILGDAMMKVLGKQ
jgi:hypothetical protein